MKVNNTNGYAHADALVLSVLFALAGFFTNTIINKQEDKFQYVVTTSKRAFVVKTCGVGEVFTYTTLDGQNVATRSPEFVCTRSEVLNER